jgi:hypothetical protein
MRVRLRPTWRQLCVIATEQLRAVPTADDFEWAETIKSRLIGLGFTYPSQPHQLTEAMRAVQRAMEKSWGPRPVPLPPHPASSPAPTQADPPWPKRNGRPQGWTPVQHLLEILKPRGNGSPSSLEAPVKVTRPLTLREAERRRASKIYAQALLEQVQRCEDAESAAAAAERDPEVKS